MVQLNVTNILKNLNHSGGECLNIENRIYREELNIENRIYQRGIKHREQNILERN